MKYGIKLLHRLHCWQLELLWYVWEYAVTRWLRC